MRVQLKIMCDQLLANVASMAGTLPHAVLADRATEILPFGEEGSGIAGGIEQALEPPTDDEDVP